MKTKVLFLSIFVFVHFFALSQSIELTPNNTINMQNAGNNIYIQSNAVIEIVGLRHNGSFLSPTATLLDNTLLRMEGAGNNGFAFTNAKARIDFTASENWNSSSTGSQMRFWTNANGTNAMLERMIISNNGNVGINTSSPDSKLHLVGGENNGTTASLKISSPGANMILDGNEIDSDVPIFINYNSNKDVSLAKGGGLVFVGTFGTGIKSIIKETVSIPTFTVSPNSCSAVYADMNNISPQSTFHISPEGALANGLFIAYARYSSTGEVGIRICNVTSSSSVQPAIDFHITAIK
ncbi:hypothetical protein EGI22_01200 [Lacihabitans sp. LS3-19]|uniref:hypothetical protein n=1 Tax=Lacihabitans sp. LS3-19 TaxID=2487335 RepID=UPI0020CF8391|nr:hypothetical protein [Lacihabitans sp. LS3-19]MCP9766504.1 hypothetical protein [Lacihabitans sp. LS3-19]